jgi:PadR family transcriptional regulator PadR
MRRVTEPLLDVLELLIWSYFNGNDPHGWLIMKATKRTGPTVYGVLDRLEEAGWVIGRWDAQAPEEEGRPRRRLYRLTEDGMAGAKTLLAERRPEAAKNPAGTLRPGIAFLRSAWQGLGGAR